MDNLRLYLSCLYHNGNTYYIHDLCMYTVCVCPIDTHTSYLYHNGNTYYMHDLCMYKVCVCPIDTHTSYLYYNGNTYNIHDLCMYIVCVCPIDTHTFDCSAYFISTIVFFTFPFNIQTHHTKYYLLLLPYVFFDDIYI